MHQMRGQIAEEGLGLLADQRRRVAGEERELLTEWSHRSTNHQELVARLLCPQREVTLGLLAPHLVLDDLDTRAEGAEHDRVVIHDRIEQRVPQIIRSS